MVREILDLLKKEKGEKMVETDILIVSFNGPNGNVEVGILKTEKNPIRQLLEAGFDLIIFSTIHGTKGL
jgi:hypothetical protein